MDEAENRFIDSQDFSHLAIRTPYLEIFQSPGEVVGRRHILEILKDTGHDKKWFLHDGRYMYVYITYIHTLIHTDIYIYSIYFFAIHAAGSFLAYMYIYIYLYILYVSVCFVFLSGVKIPSYRCCLPSVDRFTHRDDQRNVVIRNRSWIWRSWIFEKGYLKSFLINPYYYNYVLILFIYDHIGSFQYHFKSLYSGIIWYPPQCLFKSLAPTISSFGSWVFQSQIQAFLRHTAFAQQKWSNNVPLDRAESGRIHGHTAIPWKIRKARMFPRCEYASFCTLKFEAIWTFWLVPKPTGFP